MGSISESVKARVDKDAHPQQSREEKDQIDEAEPCEELAPRSIVPGYSDFTWVVVLHKDILSFNYPGTLPHVLFFASVLIYRMWIS